MLLFKPKLLGLRVFSRTTRIKQTKIIFTWKLRLRNSFFMELRRTTRDNFRRNKNLKPTFSGVRGVKLGKNL